MGSGHDPTLLIDMEPMFKLVETGAPCSLAAEELVNSQ